MTWRLETREAVAFLREVRKAADDELEKVVERGSRRVADIAKAQKDYTDRTTDLRFNTEPIEVKGVASRGTLRGGVRAGMHYAAYVEDKGYRVLTFAAELAEPYIVQDAERGLNIAVYRAGNR